MTKDDYYKLLIALLNKNLEKSKELYYLVLGYLRNGL